MEPTWVNWHSYLPCSPVFLQASPIVSISCHLFQYLLGEIRVYNIATCIQLLILWDTNIHSKFTWLMWMMSMSVYILYISLMFCRIRIYFLLLHIHNINISKIFSSEWSTLNSPPPPESCFPFSSSLSSIWYMFGENTLTKKVRNEISKENAYALPSFKSTSWILLCTSWWSAGNVNAANVRWIPVSVKHLTFLFFYLTQDTLYLNLNCSLMTV